MCSRKSSALAIMALAAAISPCPSSAQPAGAAYRKVYCGDIIQGYVPLGQSIETSGHIWYLPTGVFLLPNLISAQNPLVIDVSAMPAENRTRLLTCRASALYVGGCDTLIWGDTGLVDGRRGIFAHEIDIQAGP